MLYFMTCLPQHTFCHRFDVYDHGLFRDQQATLSSRQRSKDIGPNTLRRDIFLPRSQRAWNAELYFMISHAL